MNPRSPTGVLLGLVAALALAPSAPASEDAPFEPRLYLGGLRGTERNVVEAELLLPLLQTRRSVWLGSFRQRIDTDESSEWNLGLGYRRSVFEDQYVIGAFATLDRLDSRHSNRFFQGTVGTELVSDVWEARLNAYAPEAGIKIAADAPNDTTPLIEGNAILVRDDETHERALPGVDLEIGRRLPLGSQNVWLYAGGYHFNRSGFDDVTGPRVRATWRADLDRWLGFDAGVELGLAYQRDDVRGSQTYAGFELRLRGSSDDTAWSRSRSARRLMRRFVRDTDVVTTTRHRETPAQAALHPGTGRPYSGIYYAQEGASGAGTFDDPTDLDTAIALAGTDGVVVPLGAGGVFDTTGIALVPGMSVVGGGSGLAVMNAVGTQVDLAVGGTRPTLRGLGAADIVRVGDGAADVLVRGLDLRDGDDAVFGRDNARLWLDDVRIDAPGRRGISLLRPSELRIDGVSVSNAAREGFFLDAPRGRIDGSRWSVATSGQRGVFIRNSTDAVALSGITVSDANGRGVDLTNVAGAISLAGVDVRDSRLQDVLINQAGSSVSIAGLTSRRAGREGLYVQSVAGRVSLSNVDVRDSTREALEARLVSGPLSIGGATFANSGGLAAVYLDRVGDVGLSQLSTSGGVRGIHTRLLPGSFSLNGASIQSPSREGIYLNVTSGAVSLSNLTVDSSGQRGIYVRNAGSAVSLASVSVADANSRGIELFNTAGSVNLSSVGVRDSRLEDVLLNRVGGFVSIAGLSSLRAGREGLRLIRVSGEGTLGSIDVRDSTREAIEAVRVTGPFSLTGATIANSGGAAGVYLNQMGDVRVSQLATTGGARGLWANRVTGSLSLTRSSFSGTTREGVRLQTLSGPAALSDLTITGSGREGLLVATALGSLDVARTSVTGSGREGLRLTNLRDRFTLRDSTITAAGAEGIELSSPRGEVAIGSTRIDGALRGIYIRNAFDATRIDDVDVANVTREGIYVWLARDDLTISNSRIETGIGRTPLFLGAIGTGRIEVTDSRIGAAANGAASLLLYTYGNASSLDAVIARNQIAGTNTGVLAYNIFGTLRTSFESNSITGTTRGIDLLGRRTLDATLLNNAADGQIRVRNVGSAANLCVDVRGNSTTANLQLRRSGTPTFDVRDRDGAQAANPAHVVFTPNIGSFGTVASCPTP